MRRTDWRFGLVAAAASLCAVPGHTQPANPEVPAATRTVNLTLEQRHVIRELVRDMKIDPADDLKVAAGDDVPGKVQVHAMPTIIGQKVPQIRSHRFYVTQRQIVIVDPDAQKVVEVIE